MTDDQHPRGGGPMLDRALEPYPEPRSTFPATISGTVFDLHDLIGDPGLETTPEPLLEVLAEALAASYGRTTFETAARLIGELEIRHLRIASRIR